MAYDALNSPLPNLTVSAGPKRCCGSRGLGQDGSSSDSSTVDLSTLPVDTSVDSTSITENYPDMVGTEFVSAGGGDYTNIQTGQVVPYSTAVAITGATTGPAMASMDTTSAVLPTATLSINDVVDPSTGNSYSGALTAAAAALQATGSLVNAATGHLTPAGQALAQQGQLVSTPAMSVSGSLQSLAEWFTAQTMFPGVPNAVVLVGGLALVAVLGQMMTGKKRR